MKPGCGDFSTTGLGRTNSDSQKSTMPCRNRVTLRVNQPTYVKGERGKYQLVVSKKSWEKFKQKLKTITRKTTPMSFDERIEKLNEVQRGWVNNFRMAIAQSPILGTTITVERLKKRGYISLLELYNQLKPYTGLFL